MPGIPTDWAALQWALDKDIGDTLPYEAGLVEGKAALQSLEAYGTHRRPRGQRCFEFDGVDDSMVATHAALATPITISLWYRKDSIETGYKLAFGTRRTDGSDDAFKIQVRNQFSPNNIMLALMDNGFTESLVFNASGTEFSDVWMHLAGVYESGAGDQTMRLYLNGVQVANRASSFIAANLTEAIVSDDQVAGTISAISVRDCRIYNVTKSTLEIAAIMAGGVDVTGIVAQYHCNEESGLVAYDSSGNGNDGTITGVVQEDFHSTDLGVLTNPANDVGFTDNAGVIVPRDESTPTDDVLGGTLQYTGSTARPIVTETPVWTGDGSVTEINIPTVPALQISGNITIAIWIRFTNTTSSKGIFASWDASNGIMLWTRPGQIQLYTDGITTSSTALHNDDKPHLLVGVVDGTDARLLIDNGLEDVSTSLPGGLAGITADWWIGRYNTNSQHVNAKLWGARIFNRALTADELTYLWDGSGTDPGDPVGHWPLAEGDGRTAYDVSGNGNHGSINNGVVADIWANVTDATRDHCIEYGGRMETDVFVPGLLDGSNAANGSPITLLPKQFGNPKSNLVFDTWGAPKLSQLNLPALSPPGELLRHVAPDNTKFRSEDGGTDIADGTAFADGDNRVFNSPDLTGQSLTDAIDYIGRGGAPLTPPVNTVAPAVTGSPVEGQTLTCDGGTWIGNPTPTLTYQWWNGMDSELSDGAPIAGATSATYLLGGDDVDTYMKCVVTATNSEGAVSEDSDIVGPITEAPTGFVPAWAIKTTVVQAFGR